MKNIAIFSGSKLGQGPWRPGKKVWSIAIFGGAEIDFRQAELEENVTHVVAFSLFGGNAIVVPQDMPITFSGFSILGGKSMKRSQTKMLPPASAKALHINAINILGGLTVTDEQSNSHDTVKRASAQRLILHKGKCLSGPLFS